MNLVVGLGNPGKEYQHTRHNTGFRCIDVLSKAQGIRLKGRHRLAHFGPGVVDGTEVVLAKPQTYMNESGRAVAWLLSRFPVPVENLVVVYDDLDLPLGKIRIRTEGGAGGHKGMRSIISTLGTERFPRVRIGIGRPGEESEDAVDYVLSSFTSEEEKSVQDIIQKAADAVTCILSEGIEVAMNKYNQVSILP